jgi:hypothetical protein
MPAHESFRASTCLKRNSKWLANGELTCTNAQSSISVVGYRLLFQEILSQSLGSAFFEDGENSMEQIWCDWTMQPPEFAWLNMYREDRDEHFDEEGYKERCNEALSPPIDTSALGSAL